MTKKRICILLILSLVVSLTACGSSPAEVPETAETGQTGDVTGDAIVFETTDLAGNTVRSQDVFRANRLTAVNLWGTYCGPCLSEMPDLEVLNERLKEKNCAVIGVVIDVGADDAAMIRTAEDIIADTGVTYLNLLPWDNLMADFPAQFIPTTYFIDGNGCIVGTPAVGARGADDYEALIDAALESTGLS